MVFAGILYVLLHFPLATSSSNMGIIRDTLSFVLSLESDSDGRAGQGTFQEQVLYFKSLPCLWQDQAGH